MRNYRVIPTFSASRVLSPCALPCTALVQVHQHEAVGNWYAADGSFLRMWKDAHEILGATP